MRDSAGTLFPGGARASDAGTLVVMVVTTRADADWDFDPMVRTSVLEPAQAGSVDGAQPDVFVVDTTEGNEFDVVRLLAQGGSQPVVVYGPAASSDALRYLDIGAADYISPRTSRVERAARLRAAARRNSARRASDQDIVIQDVTISLHRHEVRRGGEIVHLTPHEFELLEVLLRSANQIVPHRKLMAQVWGVENTSSRHYLRIYIRQLRQKLERNPDEPAIIVTEWGRGYVLRTGAAARAASA
jgi:two-component system, OmpR family, KDP operon response regulator KdpE